MRVPSLFRYPHPEPERMRLAPDRVRVYVWERPVRLAHWLLALSIVVLSFTGYYLYNPFIVSRGRGAYLMGAMRFLHEVTAIVFIFAVLLRLYWYFYSNRWSRIDQFLPLSRERWRDIRETGKFYSFLRWYPTRHIGHNALAGAAYAAIYGLALVEIFTGLVLFNAHVHNPFLAAAVGWAGRWFDIQWVTLTHFLLMFAFWLFLIHHLYSGLLSASEERNGLMGSIFTGYKFVPAEQVREELGAEAEDQSLSAAPGASRP